MAQPLLSIVIPTRDRARLLPLAVESALRQTVRDLEVIVVDDASAEPPALPVDPRLRLIRLPASRGGPGARNAGAAVAHGRWLTFLDDDDKLLPHMAEVSLQALTGATLPPPVAVISGVDWVTPEGELRETHLPPTVPRGGHFFLEEPQRGCSHFATRALVVEADVLRGIGGWDEDPASMRCWSELFLRLNPVCSILGLPVVTYRQLIHDGPRISRDPGFPEQSFEYLVAKHRATFEAHPEGYAAYLLEHALELRHVGERSRAAAMLTQALRVAPRPTLWAIASVTARKIARAAGV